MPLAAGRCDQGSVALRLGCGLAMLVLFVTLDKHFVTASQRPVTSLFQAAVIGRRSSGED